MDLTAGLCLIVVVGLSCVDTVMCLFQKPVLGTYEKENSSISEVVRWMENLSGVEISFQE